jgi:hypothetical protein
MIFGVARLRWRPQTAMNWILGFSVVLGGLLGPTAFLDRYGETKAPHPPAEHRTAQREALALIPSSAPVSATNRLGGHLSERRYVYVFPALEKADWVAVDEQDPWLPTRKTFGSRRGLSIEIRDGFRQLQRLKAVVAGLEADPGWRLAYRRDGISVFRRSSSS